MISVSSRATWSRKTASGQPGLPSEAWSQKKKKSGFLSYVAVTSSSTPLFFGDVRYLIKGLCDVNVIGTSVVF